MLCCPRSNRHTVSKTRERRTRSELERRHLSPYKPSGELGTVFVEAECITDEVFRSLLSPARSRCSGCHCVQRAGLRYDVASNDDCVLEVDVPSTVGQQQESLRTADGLILPPSSPCKLSDASGSHMFILRSCIAFAAG